MSISTPFLFLRYEFFFSKWNQVISNLTGTELLKALCLDVIIQWPNTASIRNGGTFFYDV
jgi:hypothetical protein